LAPYAIQITAKLWHASLESTQQLGDDGRRGIQMLAPDGDLDFDPMEGSLNLSTTQRKLCMRERKRSDEEKGKSAKKSEACSKSIV